MKTEILKAYQTHFVRKDARLLIPPVLPQPRETFELQFGVNAITSSKDESTTWNGLSLRWEFWFHSG